MLIALLLPAPLEGGDECEALLPSSLRKAVARAYPRFRPVRVSDYSAEDIRSERQHHHDSPCLGVASADVDGDGRRDFALLITARNGTTHLIAARPSAKGTWRIEKLGDWGDEGPSRSYVNVVEPGAYEDLGLSEELEPGQVSHYRADLPGFIAGGIESSGAAFFFTGRKWVHLWLSD